MSSVYNRGFWDGYYLGRKMGEWSNVHGSVATTRKIYIGKGVKYFDKIGVGEFVMESHDINVGEKSSSLGQPPAIEADVEKLDWAKEHRLTQPKRRHHFFENR